MTNNSLCIRTRPDDVSNEITNMQVSTLMQANISEIFSTLSEELSRAIQDFEEMHTETTRC